MATEYRLRAQEQETTITITRDEDFARIYTSDRRMMARLDALAREYPEEYKVTWADHQIMGDNLPMGKRYAVRRKLVRFAKPVSEERKEKLRAQAQRMISAQKTPVEQGEK